MNAQNSLMVFGILRFENGGFRHRLRNVTKIVTNWEKQREIQALPRVQEYI
jgi:hypothetical protein